MSKTALDLSRALERLENKVVPLLPIEANWVKGIARKARLARGIERLSARLRAIPADADKRIAEMKQDEMQNMRWLKEAHEQRNWDGVSAVLYCSRTPELTKEDLEWAMGAIEGKEDVMSTVPGVGGGVAVSDGERRVRAMSTELLNKNLPAVGQARSQWQAMSKGLLEEKPDCPLCEVSPEDTCDTGCALYEFSENESNNCGPEYHAWGKALGRARCQVLDVPRRMRDPAVMTAAGKMADLLDRLHGVIADELRARAEEARDIGPEIWHGFKVGERVYHRPKTHGITGVIIGGNEKMVTVKYDDGRVHSTYPTFIEHVQSWHGFEEGTRVRHKFGHMPRDFGIVVGGNGTELAVKYNDGQTISNDPEDHVYAPTTPEPDRRCGTCAYWPKNGPPEGLEGNHRPPCDPKYLGTPPAHLLSDFVCKHWKPRDCNSCEVACSAPGERTDGCWKPKPRTPDHDCSTCGNLGCELHGRKCALKDLPCWQLYSHGSDPDLCSVCAHDDDCDAFSGEECSYEPKPGPKHASCSTCWHNEKTRPCPSGAFPNCWAPAHLCSECADHGKCDGDSTPEDGCWQANPEPKCKTYKHHNKCSNDRFLSCVRAPASAPEPWPGWEAQDVRACDPSKQVRPFSPCVSVPITPILREGVTGVTAELEGGRLVIRWRDPYGATVLMFHAVPYEDGTRLGRIINELAERAGLSGKAGG